VGRRGLLFIRAGFCALLAVVFLVGQASALAVELRVLMEPDGRGVWRELFSEFHRQHPDIRVVPIEGPASTDVREDMYVNSLLAGSRDYDLVYADTIWIPKFAAAGWLTDLTDRWPEEKWSEFAKAAVAGGTYRDRVYRVPTQLNGGLLYYRKDILDKMGAAAPKTYEDIEALAKASPDPASAFVWQGKQYEGLTCNFLEVLRGYGGYWIENGEVGLDRPEAEKALEFLRRTVGTISPAGVTTYAEEESRLLFQSGRALFLRNWPYVSNLLAKDKLPPGFEVGIAPLPAPTFGGAGFAILTSSPSQEAAWKFLEFVSSPEAVQLLYDRGGVQPARKSFYAASTDPRQQALYAALEHTVPRPALPQYAQASDILQRQVSAALTGQKSPREALRQAAEETRRLLARP
jgi:multiple sugar transport system substrate-binding protein